MYSFLCCEWSAVSRGGHPSCSTYGRCTYVPPRLVGQSEPVWPSGKALGW